MNPKCHERMENIALPFTQNPSASQQGRDDSGGDGGGDMLPTFFGADSTREARVEPSVLGSVIPELDPDPPYRPRNNALTSDGTSPSPGVAGTKRPLTTGSSVGKGSKPWAGGAGGGTAAVGRRLAVRQHGVGVVRKRTPRVKHGLRVLLRGTPRCGKSAILWDYCHRAALVGHRVVLVCLRKKEGDDLANLPRSLRAGRSPGGDDELRGWEAPALGRIGIKYVRSRDDLAWYLASLHTLRRKEWPTVIAVDDVDKIIEASAGGGGGGGSGSGGGGGGGGGGFGASTLRILALLQDTAEFFDRSRAEPAASSAVAAASAAAAAAAEAASDAIAEGTLTTTTANAPQQVPKVVAREREGEGEGGGNSNCRLPSLGRGSPETGSPRDRGGGGGASGRAPGEISRLAGGGAAEGHEEAAVRVVGTCSTSDRGMLSLCGRFVHEVARVQNTTGPDCFCLRLDPSISTAPKPHGHPHPRGGLRRGAFAPGVTPLNGGGAANGGGSWSGSGSGSVGSSGATDGGVAEVDFVRSQLDGSFALF